MTVSVLHPVPVLPTLDDLLSRAREGRHRPSPHEALDAVARGTLLVDIRAHQVRVEDGEIEGAHVVDRNLLEWRLDPRSDVRLPGVTYDQPVVVVSSSGRASSLAVASLHTLGLTQTTDLDGGFAAWRSAGLPTVPGGTPAGERSRARWLTVDVDRWEVRVRGELIHLTAQEFRVLRLLVDAQGRVVTRTLLSQHLDIYPAEGRALDVHVCRLRRKLGDTASQLVTVRSVGWRLHTS